MSCGEASLSIRPEGANTMGTATTLVMITLLGLASAQVNASPVSGDNSLTGVPMVRAKRP
jgi:hypothetical protein